mgnify:CR=1 FL=1
MLIKVGQKFETWMRKVLPDPLVIAIILTLIVGLLAVIFTPTTPIQVVENWSKGFWELIAFTMQVAFGLIAGAVLAKSPIVNRGMVKLCSLPKKNSMGRDLLHTLVMELGLSRCSGKILEFGGPGARSMPLASRVTVCNLINYLGCVSAVFDPDADAQTENAYSELIHLDLGCIEPCLAAPPSIANAVPLSKAAGTQIDIGIIGTCAGGGLEDLEAAAHVLSGRRLAPGRKLYISPATAAIQSEAIRRGYYQIFSDAGCFLSSPTCDFCYGAAAYLGAGKRAISTQTLNVSGRLGSLDSEIYLASAAAVAAAAVQGEICDPRDFWKEAEA